MNTPIESIEELWASPEPGKPRYVSEELWSEFKRLYMEGLADEYTPHDDVLRAALEAIAPRLRAEGLREAAGLVGDELRPHILNRAQELEK